MDERPFPEEVVVGEALAPVTAAQGAGRSVERPRSEEWSEYQLANAVS